MNYLILFYLLLCITKRGLSYWGKGFYLNEKMFYLNEKNESVLLGRRRHLNRKPFNKSPLKTDTVPVAKHWASLVQIWRLNSTVDGMRATTGLLYSLSVGDFWLSEENRENVQ